MRRLDSYVEGWLERARAREREAAGRRAQRLEAVRALAERLVAELGARRVVLFGSLARGDDTEASDVDILVYGLPPARLLEAMVAADRLLPGVAVDLVPAERARPGVRERAEGEGRVLRAA